MPKNETPLMWIEKYHPEVYALYLEYRKNKRRQQARDFQRRLAEKAKANDQAPVR